MFRSILFGQIMIVLLCATRVESETPLSTEFTYQGNLSSSGMPAVSTADFQLSLYDALIGGSQVGQTLSRTNVALVRGTFTLALDFGSPAFTGNARWIEVAVRSPAGSGNYTTLAPRQPITATPHATYSLQTRGIVVDDSGRVGVGITPPANNSNKLEVAGSVAVSNGSGFFARNAAGTGIGYGMIRDFGDELALYAGGSEKMHLNADGRVGIGETQPSAKLHVRDSSNVSGPAVAIEGNGQASLRFYPQGPSNILTTGDIGFPHFDEQVLFIRNFDPAARIAFSGAEGTRYPPSGMEDLRIIRGRVFGDGTVDAGTGFTVTRVNEGEYVITYAQPFAGDPSVTATINSAGFSSAFIELRANSTVSCAPNVIRRSDGNHVDGHFNFIAIGPR